MRIPVELFSLPHLALLAPVPLLSLLFIWLGRRSAQADRPLRWGMALILGLCPLLFHGRILLLGQGLFPFHLPLELCDIALFLAIGCLLSPSAPLYDIAYYWCLLGPAMALAQPNLVEPSVFLTVHFFLSHGLTIVAVVYLAGTGQRRPRPGSLTRSAIALNLLMVAVAAFDARFDADYMFLLRKPPTRSLLDWFGPWPWDLAVCEAVGLLLFALAYLPFRLRSAASCLDAGPNSSHSLLS